MKSTSRQHIIDICEGFIESCPYLIPEGLEISFILDEDDYRSIYQDIVNEYMSIGIGSNKFNKLNNLSEYIIESRQFYTIKYINRDFVNNETKDDYLPNVISTQWYQTFSGEVKDNKLSNLSLSDLNVIRSLLPSQTFDSDLTREQRSDLQEKVVLELQNRLKKLI